MNGQVIQLAQITKYLWIIYPLIIWTTAWKGWALWRAAKNNSVPWFVVLLVVNTLGILEIIYIFGFSGYGKKDK